MNREIWAYPGRKPALDEWQEALAKALADTTKRPQAEPCPCQCHKEVA